MQAKGRLVAVDAGRPIASITRPKPPQNQIRAIGLWEESQPIDSAMFAEPVARLDVVDPLIAGIPEGSSLLGRKIPPLSFSDPVQLLLSLIRGSHNRSTFLTHYALRRISRQVHSDLKFCPFKPHRSGPSLYAPGCVVRLTNADIKRDMMLAARPGIRCPFSHGRIAGAGWLSLNLLDTS